MTTKENLQLNLSKLQLLLRKECSDSRRKSALIGWEYQLFKMFSCENYCKNTSFAHNVWQPSFTVSPHFGFPFSCIKHKPLHTANSKNINAIDGKKKIAQNVR